MSESVKRAVWAKKSTPVMMKEGPGTRSTIAGTRIETSGGCAVDGGGVGSSVGRHVRLLVGARLSAASLSSREGSASGFV